MGRVDPGQSPQGGGSNGGPLYPILDGCQGRLPPAGASLWYKRGFRGRVLLAIGPRSARRLALGLLLGMLCSLPARAGQKPWTEVRSPHFRVLTDGNAGDARRVAREFEQMRAVFANAFPNMRLDSGSPLLVLAPRDEAAMKALAPELWKQKGVKPAGFFEHGWEKQYAVVRLDQIAPDAYEVVYHEYVHSLLHLSFRWLPTWMDEGFAELYGNTRFEQTRMLIGAPSWRLRVVQSRPLIPLDTLLAVTPASPYYHEEDKVEMFYAESWALTHFLIFGPGMESGRRFNQFFRLVQQGEEQEKAFHQVFGDSQELEKALRQYVTKFALSAWVMKNPPQTEEKDFGARELTAAETEAELGSYFLFTHDLASARAPIQQAVADDARLGLAHEDMGFLDFAGGRDEEAAREFARAFELDGKLYLSLYYRTMLAPAEAESREKALLQVLSLNLQFAPAYIQLARLYVSQGKLEEALAQSRKAEQLEPARAGYHLMSGQILLRLGRGAEAAAFAKDVAGRWFGPDHNEAVELWQRVPAEQRPAGAAPVTALPPGAQSAEGRVKSVACGPPDQGMTLVLEEEGQSRSFRAKGPWQTGFSDTLWYGADHFSPCRHVQGLRAIVRFRPSSGGDAGEIAALELRVDLPQPAAPPTTQAVPPPPKP